MDKYMKKSDVIAYIRKEAKEAQSAFDELGGESGIIAEAFNDLANDFSQGAVPYTTAEEAFAQIPSADVAQWISVKDRLPDVNRAGSGYEEITVIATDGERVRPMIYERACVRDKTKCRWKWIWDRIYKGKPIVAWMPLPEPPKGDADNG